MGIRIVRMSVVNQNVDTIPHFQMSLLSQIKIIRLKIYVQNKAIQYNCSLKGQLESEHKDIYVQTILIFTSSPLDHRSCVYH